MLNAKNNAFCATCDMNKDIKSESVHEENFALSDDELPSPLKNNNQDTSSYDIEPLEEGISCLTGSKRINLKGEKVFTVLELEVFKVN